MDKKTVLKIIRQFGQALLDNGIHSSRIILYGSYARGDWGEWSDIDLVVISDNFADKGYWERIDVLSEAIFAVHKPIEAVAMTPEEWESGKSMIVHFAKDGELVYSV